MRFLRVRCLMALVGMLALAGTMRAYAGSPLSNDPSPLAVCQDTIRTAALRLADDVRRGSSACLTRGIECVVGAESEQASCCERAAGRCEGDLRKIEKARARFTTYVTRRRCAVLPFEEVLAELGYDAIAGRCDGAADSLDALAECLAQLTTSETACLVGTTELPRAADGLDCLGIGERFVATTSTDLASCANLTAPTVSPTPESTATPIVTASALTTTTPIATATPVATTTVVATFTATATAVRTATPTPSVLATVTPLPSATASSTATRTASPSPTIAPTLSAAATSTPLPSASATPTRTVTPVGTGTPVPTATTTVISTPIATPTAAPTSTSTAMSTSTAIAATATRTATPALTATTLATATPILTATPVATATATPIPTSTPTKTSTPVATTTPVPTTTATRTSTPVITSTPTITATRTSTPLPTSTRTATPIPTITATPSGPVCGNGVKQTGEDCDDGNTLDCDTCPSDCKNAPADCTFEADTTRAPQKISIKLANGEPLTSANICLRYPPQSVGFPATGAVPARISGFTGQTSLADFNSSARIALLGRNALTEMTLTVSFNLCKGQTAPLPTAYACAAVSASNAGTTIPPETVQCVPVAP